MLSGLILLVIHGAGWALIALFAIRLIGWYPRGYRQLFLGLGLDLAALSVCCFPEVSRSFGLPVWSAVLGPFGLRPGSPQLSFITVIIAFFLEVGAMVLCVRAFVGACQAAEELRYSRRSATDRDVVNSAGR